jgi:hypothetical protein
MLLKEKIKIFNKELALIKSFQVKKFVIECLDAAPDYIFINCPSSSTGKYHSADEFTPLGNVLHTKRVVSNCVVMARAFSLTGKDEDLVIGAAILHDVVKQGFKQTGHTVNNHAALAAELLERVFKTTESKIEKKDYEIIRGCVFFHNGVWTPKPDNILIKDFTIPQLCVHMADYSATKFHAGSVVNGKEDIFVEFKNFVEDFKLKFRIDDIRDIPIITGKLFGAMCSSIKNFSAMEEKLMMIAAWCIKAILYLRIHKGGQI